MMLVRHACGGAILGLIVWHAISAVFGIPNSHAAEYVAAGISGCAVYAWLRWGNLKARIGEKK